MKNKFLLLNLLLIFILTSCSLGFTRNTNPDVEKFVADIIVDNGVKYNYNIEDGGFIITDTSLYDKNSKEVSIPNVIGDDNVPVVGIGYKAFMGFNALEIVNIPKSIISLDSLAFYLCGNLKEVRYEGSIAEWFAMDRSSTWADSTGDFRIYCSDGLLDKHSNVISIDEETGAVIVGSTAKADDFVYEKDVYTGGYIVKGFKEGKDNSVIAEIPATYKDTLVTSIGEDAFKGNTSLRSVVLPSLAGAIGDSAFEGCTNLEVVTFKGSASRIGEAAFKGCENLTNVTVHGSVPRIMSSAFENCKKLKSFKLVGIILTMDSKAFYNCISLESFEALSIHKENVTVGDSVFEGCTSLSKFFMNLSSSILVSVGDYSFKNCKRLTNSGALNFFYKLQTIGKEAFYNCSSLVIPANYKNSILKFDYLTSLGEGAFVGVLNNTFGVGGIDTLYDSFNEHALVYVTPIVLYNTVKETELHKKYNLAFAIELNAKHDIKDLIQIGESAGGRKCMPAPRQGISADFEVQNIYNDYDNFFKRWDSESETKKYNGWAVSKIPRYRTSFRTYTHDVKFDWKCGYYSCAKPFPGTIKIEMTCSNGKKSTWECKYSKYGWNPLLLNKSTVHSCTCQ